MKDILKFEEWWKENSERLESLQCTHLVDMAGLKLVAMEAWEEGNDEGWRRGYKEAGEDEAYRNLIFKTSAWEDA